MNSDELAGILFEKRCRACGEPLLREGAYCSRSCRIKWAEYQAFATLRLIIGDAHWAGAATQEQLRRDYFREKMQEAMRKLPSSENALVQLLIDILEEL